jgi:hypothetical protein
VPSRIRRLLLVSHREVNDRADLVRIGQHIERDAPDLRVEVVRDRPHRWLCARLAMRPTLVYSAMPLKRLRPLRGALLQGVLQTKIAEMQALERAGIPVPRWRPVTREAPPPDVSEFGPYVVMKPDLGGRGADVRIVRSNKVRFLDPMTRAAAGTQRWIAQHYVHTGPWPTSQRVLTLCGAPLFAIRQRADTSRPPIRHAADFGGGGRSIVASHVGCSIEFCHDADILALAERAARAFPQIPLLGIDILRDADSGELYVIEVNSSGRCWGFSSKRGAAMQERLGRRYESQFDAFARAARVLAEETRRRAR